MSTRRAKPAEASVAERIDAFRSQAAKVRAHPLFAYDEYTFSFQARVLTSGSSQFLFPPATPDQQHYLASVLRPFMSQDDLPSLGRCFNLFDQVIDDALLRQALSDIRADYLSALKSVMFFSTPAWKQGDPPPTVFYSDRDIADALLYGGGLIHMNAEKRRILRSLDGPGSDEWPTPPLCASSTSPGPPPCAWTTASDSPTNRAPEVLRRRGASDQAGRRRLDSKGRTRTLMSSRQGGNIEIANVIDSAVGGLAGLPEGTSMLDQANADLAAKVKRTKGQRSP